MSRRTMALAVAILLMLSAATVAGGAQPAGSSVEDAQLRPMELPDILGWKRIGTRLLSADGGWFAYTLQPNEGDSELVVRSTATDAEYRFAVGEITGFGSLAMSFSEDSRWLAFEIRPDGAAAKKKKGKARKGLGVVELSSGEMTRFDHVRSFAVGGREPAWLAFLQYAPESRAQDSEKWEGSDLILRRLHDGVSMTIGNVSEFAFNDPGSLLAMAIDTRERLGNGLQVRELASGRVLPLDSGEAIYQKIHWTDEGDAFAVLKGVKDEDFEDELYSVLGFRAFDQELPSRVHYDPAVDESFPAGLSVSPDHVAGWNDARDSLVFRIREVKGSESAGDADENGKGGETDEDADPAPRAPGGADDELDTADLVIWHWRDRRLQSRQQVQQGRDRSFGYLSVYRVDEDRFVRLADEELRDVSPAPKQRYGLGRDNATYERQGNLDGRRYRDVWVVDMVTGERYLALEQIRWLFDASPDGTHFLYFHEGNFFSYDMEARASSNLTAQLPVPFWNEQDDHNVVMPPIFQFGFGWSEDGSQLLLSDGWDIWKMAADGSGAVNLTVDAREHQIRFRAPARLDPDAKGIDLSQPLYVTAYGEWTKKGGLARLDAERPGVEMLRWDDAVFGGLLKAEEVEVYAYTRQTQAEFPDVRVVDASFSNGRRITDANPQQAAIAWSAGVRLVDYTSAKGDKLQAALYLPANYEAGKAYPTIVYIYEKLSQRANSYQGPTANGFNKSAYTSNGYAVLMPDIVYQVDDPGMSAVWCVLPALDAAVQTGVVDPDAVGLHGHSWGGYQTSFLITQTDRFSAAIAGAPLTNMISMYSLIYKNSGGGNGAIFESSQGRFTGGPWDVPQAYVRNSPVYHARNVTTPLILLHNDKDGAVDFTQGVEYYNTLRRLDKNVVLLEYVGENHGLRKPANRKDYTVRMREFFDHYLRDLGMPGWLREGVPYLKLEDHLEERAEAIAEEIKQAEAEEIEKAEVSGNEKTESEETEGEAADPEGSGTPSSRRRWSVASPRQGVAR